MAKKAEPKFKIVQSPTGKMVNGEYVFYYRQRLDKVTLPKSFDGVLVIPEEVTQLGRLCCANLTTIKEVVLPQKLESLGILAFSGCTNLEKINIPDGLRFLNASCFANCTSLSELQIPASVNASGSDFIDLPSSVIVTIDEANPYMKTEDKTILSKDGKRLIRFLGDEEEYSVKDGITCIGFNSFEGCQNLKKVVLPASITEIGHRAFCCPNLTDVVVMSEVIENIEMNPFEYCPNLTNIVVKSEAIKNKFKELYGCQNVNFEYYGR